MIDLIVNVLLPFAAGVVVMRVGFWLGRRHGLEERAKIAHPEPICVCRHPITFHSKRGCHYELLAQAPSGRGTRLECRCRGYEGPPGELYIPELGE